MFLLKEAFKEFDVWEDQYVARTVRFIETNRARSSCSVVVIYRMSKVVVEKLLVRMRESGIGFLAWSRGWDVYQDLICEIMSRNDCDESKQCLLEVGDQSMQIVWQIYCYRWLSRSFVRWWVNGGKMRWKSSLPPQRSSRVICMYIDWSNDKHWILLWFRSYYFSIVWKGTEAIGTELHDTITSIYSNAHIWHSGYRKIARIARCNISDFYLTA